MVWVSTESITVLYCTVLVLRTTCTVSPVILRFQPRPRVSCIEVDLEKGIHAAGDEVTYRPVEGLVGDVVVEDHAA